MFIQTSNEALSVMAGELDVFQPNMANLSQKNRQLLASKAAKIVGDIVNKMPEGYVIEIRGHSALVTGPATTNRVSRMRAKVV